MSPAVAGQSNTMQAHSFEKMLEAAGPQFCFFLRAAEGLAQVALPNPGNISTLSGDIALVTPMAME